MAENQIYENALSAIGTLSRKKTKLLLEDDIDEGNHSQDLELHSKNSEEHIFAINKDFASRFEHNKKREELQQRKFN